MKVTMVIEGFCVCGCVVCVCVVCVCVLCVCVVCVCVCLRRKRVRDDEIMSG